MTDLADLVEALRHPVASDYSYHSSWLDLMKEAATALDGMKRETIKLTAARETAEQALADEREACAKVVQKHIDEIYDAYGDYEPDTNATNLPDWASNCVEELESCAAAIRSRASEDKR